MQGPEIREINPFFPLVVIFLTAILYNEMHAATFETVYQTCTRKL